MLAFLRLTVSSLGLGENKWQVNVHLSLDSQYCIRLSGLCSSAQVEVQFTPTDRWFENRTACSFFYYLCNLTVFMLEIISKLYDTWKLLLCRWAESNKSCEVNLEMMHTETSRQKDRTWLFDCISRVGQRIYRKPLYPVILMGIIYRLHCWSVTWYLDLAGKPLACLLCCRTSHATLPFQYMKCYIVRADLKKEGEIC